MLLGSTPLRQEAVLEHFTNEMSLWTFLVEATSSSLARAQRTRRGRRVYDISIGICSKNRRYIVSSSQR